MRHACLPPSLGVRSPNRVGRVTEHISEIIAFIQGILDRELAYIAEDGSVYFDNVRNGNGFILYS